jgi:hypothetical protein
MEPWFEFKSTSSNRSSIDSAEVVTIEVVDEDGNKKDFVLHKSFVCFHSRFFNAAFNGPFSEGTSQSMIFHTYSLEAFGLFADWIYKEKIPDGPGELPNINELVFLYIIGDHLLVPKLLNQILERINDSVGTTGVLPVALFRHIYENTTVESPLRKMMIDLCIAYKHVACVEDIPHEMAVDMVNASHEHLYRKAAKLTKEKMKKYHIVEDEAFIH